MDPAQALVVTERKSQQGGVSPVQTEPARKKARPYGDQRHHRIGRSVDDFIEEAPQ
jgi:hypothetical protein